MPAGRVGGALVGSVAAAREVLLAQRDDITKGKEAGVGVRLPDASVFLDEEGGGRCSLSVSHDDSSLSVQCKAIPYFIIIPYSRRLCTLRGDVVEATVLLADSLDE